MIPCVGEGTHTSFRAITEKSTTRAKQLFPKQRRARKAVPSAIFNGKTIMTPTARTNPSMVEAVVRESGTTSMMGPCPRKTSALGSWLEQRFSKVLGHQLIAINVHENIFDS